MTYIGPSFFIRGEITSGEDLRLDGRVEGQVSVREAAIVIGPAAQMQAEVRGRTVVVNGAVRGNLSATDRLELSATARVDGSLSANTVVLAEGATFNGRIDMNQRTIARKVAQHRTAGTQKA